VCGRRAEGGLRLGGVVGRGLWWVVGCGGSGGVVLGGLAGGVAAGLGVGCYCWGLRAIGHRHHGGVVGGHRRKRSSRGVRRRCLCSTWWCGIVCWGSGGGGGWEEIVRGEGEWGFDMAWWIVSSMREWVMLWAVLL